jgi:hypothetical protein
MNVCSKIGAALLVGAASCAAFAARTVDDRGFGANRPAVNDRMLAIPLTSWPVDTKSFLAQHASAKAGNLKAATDKATVYRPIPVCRLIDTRGFPAAITLAGPLGPNTATNVNAAGSCGIPGSGVAGISISFHVRNATVNNGGFIAFLQQGAPIAGVNAVFNFGDTWVATTANISLPDDSGNFQIYIAQSSVDVIVDVNGYYQDLDLLDTGNQELDILGNVSCGSPGCKVLEVSNLGNGAALMATNVGGNNALMLNAGAFAVAGAGINSGTAAFIFEVDTGANVCGGTPSEALISHPMLNGDSSAVVLISPRERAPSSVIGVDAPPGSAGPIAAVYHACGTVDPNSRWGIRDKSGAALVNHAQYSVFIIKSQ